MVKVIISGYGKMGHIVESELALQGIECVLATEDLQSVDKKTASECVCIDFTTPTAFRANYRFIAENFKAAVVGTTGWYDISEDVFETFRANGTTLIWASNFSIGVNVLFAAVELMSKKLGEAGGYSPYIIEAHHIHKLDAPSGTAKSLASIVDDGLEGRPGSDKDMTANGPVQIQSVRCGELAGIHKVDFEGKYDRLSITHEAFSRTGLAQGAVLAAVKTEYVNGVHEFRELIG